MKRISLFFTIALFVPFLLSANTGDESLTKDFVTGNPEIKSMNAIDFGPEGILFVGDSKSASVIAIATGDTKPGDGAEEIKLKNIDKKIAAIIGTSADKINIQDMAVNPISKSIYLAIHLNDGQPGLFKVSGDKIEHMPLETVKYSKSGLKNAVGEEAEDRRGRPLRKWAVSDLAFYDGQVMVSGLSNEEFSSTFRSIPFPFTKDQSYASLEIYHAAHGQYETHSPIKTFMPFEFNGKKHLVASYTCTPLVIFPMDEIKPGKHSKGRTVAELGNRNTPLDIISYKKDGKSYLLMANSSRALMKIDPEKVAQYKDYLTEPVKESSATAGVEFLNMPYVNIQQLDSYNDSQVLAVQRLSNGDLDLYTIPVGRL